MMNRDEERNIEARRERLAGTRQRKADAIAEAGRLEREAARARDFERAKKAVQGMWEKPRPDRNADFSDPGERSVNNLVPAPGKPGRRGRRALPPMQEGIDPGAPE